mgnify:CR=1 FL=1
MNARSDRERLLADVLAEAAPPDFRAALLGETLRLARTRRHTRRAWRASAVLAVVATLGFFARRASPSLTPRASHEVVVTRPLAASAQIRTQSFESAGIITSFSSVVMVQTRLDDGAVRRISDQELLALAAPRPAALIRVGPQTQKLIFTDVIDQDDGSQ